jgi:hypothetical protein
VAAVGAGPGIVPVGVCPEEASSGVCGRSWRGTLRAELAKAFLGWAREAMAAVCAA